MSVALLGSVRAEHYTVVIEGADTDGEPALRTIQEGVDVLKPGDTLTVGPGEYFQSVRRDRLGSADRDTLIRAEIPGTVVLHGDVPAPAFRKVKGQDYVYVADFHLESQTARERQK